MKCLVFSVGFIFILATACNGNEKFSAASSQESVHFYPASKNNGVALPKLSRSSSIAGPDVDKNGIRDDVDAWIAKQNATASQKAALRQHARALQASLTVNLKDQAAVAQVSQAMSTSVKCIFTKFPGTAAPTMSTALEKITVNTKARFLANSNFSKAMSGAVIHGAQGEACEAPP